MRTQFTIDNELQVDYDTLIEMKQQLMQSDFFGTRIRIGRTKLTGIIFAQNILNTRIPIKVWNEKNRIWM
jgi:hypothetical protein